MTNNQQVNMNLALNWKRIYAANFKLGLGRAMRGIDYFRVIEYPLAFSLLELEGKNLILDIGSSDSVFPLFLASLGHQVHAIDIDRKVLSLKNYAKKMGNLNLIANIQDATKLSYPNNFFDKITAISTLEHILPLDDGDTRAIREITRTLKNGGQAIITIPCQKKFKIKWSRKMMNGHFFLTRMYDKTSIYKRLVKPSNLQLTNWILFKESIKFSKIWYNSPLCIFAFPSPFFAMSFIDFRANLKEPQGACLTFKKV